MKKNDGYTFIQLIVVLSVMAIMLVLSLNVGRSISQKASISGVVNQFMADFNYAKQLASMENRYATIVFNSDGGSYQISTQTNVGDLGNWTVVKTVEPLDGRECFNSSAIQNFAINSVGEVFNFPITSTIPNSITLSFYVKYTARGVIDYQKDVKIYPYGGIRVDE